MRKKPASVLAPHEDAVVEAYTGGASARQIATRFGVGGSTVRRVLDARGITLRVGQTVGQSLPARTEVEPDASVAALSAAELAYIAGLIDGEGCLLIYRKKDSRGGLHFRCILRIANTSLRVIAWLQVRLGGTAVPAQKPRAHHLQVYQWPCEGPRLAALLVAVRPHLVIKPELADLLISMQMTMAYSGRGLRLPEEVKAERERLFAKYQAERAEMRGR
ncbi:hypothetical protein [Lentzea cavernae]|uniref:Uncharacterized protein n=1 Tax=Lentzea cavernae TaxID=2020703 RepID=A0ABQ3MUI6_9PSEU|nr:hypothetical protein [Lentzea cavernae]GHH57838.1 hypothetical protein GCM10017774_78210 [Lentzea cavernae]